MNKAKTGKPNSMKVRTSNATSNLDDTIENYFEEESKMTFEAEKAKVKQLMYKYSDGLERNLIMEAYRSMFKNELILSNVKCNNVEDLCRKLAENKIIEQRYNNQGKLFAYPTKDFLCKYREEQNEKRLAETDFSKYIDVGLNLTTNLPNKVIGPNESIPIETWQDYENSGYIELLVSEIRSPSDFYVSVRPKNHELHELMNDMEKYYKENEHKLYVNEKKHLLGMYVAALFGQDYELDHLKPSYEGWHRAKVIAVHGNNVKVHFVDYGTQRDIDLFYLRYLHKKFCSLPAQGLRATLAAVRPISNNPNNSKIQVAKWSTGAAQRFFNLVSVTNNEKLGMNSIGIIGQVTKTMWEGTVKANLEHKIPLVLFDTVTNRHSTGIIINEMLIKEGFAEKDPSYMTADGQLPWECVAAKDKLLQADKKVVESLKNLGITKDITPSRQDSPIGYNDMLHRHKEEVAVCPPHIILEESRKKVENWLTGCQEDCKK